MNKFVFCVAALATLMLSACGVTDTSTRSEQANKASAAANAVTFERNAEIENIQKRLKLTSNPGQVGFVLLMNQAGQPIMYTSVRGKVTSGSKRLTQPDYTEYTDSAARQAPSDEGTYGTSGEYVYFWTMDGQYIQWNGGYLYSDKPFRTNVAPLVIAVAAN